MISLLYFLIYLSSAPWC